MNWARNMVFLRKPSRLAIESCLDREPVVSMKQRSFGASTRYLRALPVLAVACVLSLPLVSRAAAQECAAPTSVASVSVPGRPFAALPTADDCWVFVSLSISRDHGAVAVLHNQDGQFTLDHVVALKGVSYGESLSHDGKVLAVVGAGEVAVLDVGGLEHQAVSPILGTFHDGGSSGAIYAAISPDDRLLMVSDEDANRISVFDLAKARSDGFASPKPMGRIPMAVAPVGLAFSSDGKWLYATSEKAPRRSLAATCEPEQSSGRMHPEGVLFRIDVGLAAKDPRDAVVAAFPAGCNPVRVAVSRSGSQVWVTARGSDALLRFQTADLLARSHGVGYAKFAIGTSPVGLAVRPDGSQVWVTLSHRWGKKGMGQLAGMAFEANVSSVKLTSAPAAGFPREVAFLHDGHTLVATLFAAQRVEFVRTPP